MQRLLRHADWDTREVRDDVRDYVIEQLGDPGGVLIADETGFLKKGTRSAGVQRQYSGTAGRTENCQVGVFLAYSSPRGHALIDRELYLPQSWTEDRDRCRAAGIPDEVEFATKPRQTQAMLSRALDAGVPFAWFTADEGLRPGQVPARLARGRGRVLCAGQPPQRHPDHPRWAAGRCADRRRSGPGLQRLSVGAGAHGPREFDWARVPVRTADWRAGRGHWLLARRSISDPADIAYYACYGPRRSRLIDLAWTAGSRWHIEECFQQAKNEVGLDHYQVRSWRAWHAHNHLVDAGAGLAGRQQSPGGIRGTGANDPGMIGYTLPEIRRLLTSLIQTRAPDPQRVWSWSRWRRRRQHQARLCHYRRRGYALT